METKDFHEGLETLMEIANQRRVTLMCAELLWFRCHRRFIASTLKRQKWHVTHIYDEEKAQEHRELKRNDLLPLL